MLFSHRREVTENQLQEVVEHYDPYLPRGRFILQGSSNEVQMESTKGQLIDDVAVILYGSFGEHLEDGRVTEEEISSIINLIKQEVSK